MKVFTVEIRTKIIPYKHYEFIEAENEENAIDKAYKYYTKELHREVEDIKVI